MRELSRPQGPGVAESPVDSQAGSLTRAIWTAVAVVALLQGVTFAIQHSILVSSARPLRHQLSDLSLTLGGWTGADMTLDPIAFAAVGTQDQVARVYKNSGGDAVFVHRAAWTSQDDWTPHLPEICYSTNGWELLESHSATLPDNPSVRIAIQNYQQAGQKVVVAYWYQLDQGTYADRDGGRSLRRDHWGRRERPPLLKTLLQINDGDRAESSLLELASKIYEFNCEL
jgi:hypothetical protein